LLQTHKRSDRESCGKERLKRRRRKKGGWTEGVCPYSHPTTGSLESVRSTRRSSGRSPGLKWVLRGAF